MDDSLTVAVRVKPGSARARVGGRFDGPHGPAPELTESLRRLRDGAAG